MELADLLDELDAGRTITGDSPLHAVMHRVSQEALRRDHRRGFACTSGALADRG